ncbi:MAG: glycosyltransferase family 4 protein [Gemmatimonadota bacterium]
MNILMHCVYFPPEVGGLESHVFYLCRALVERGHRVEVVTSRSLPEAPAHEVLDGVEVHRTWFPSRSPVGWAVHSLGSTPRTLRAARDADVIHAQAFSSVPPAALGRMRSGAPLVATFHTSHFLRRATRRRWRPVLARLVRAPDYCLAASGEIAQVAEGLAPGVRVEALTNGVETELFRRTEPALAKRAGKRIIVPRRLFQKNGVEYLVRAMPAIIAGSGDVEAVLVGDGPERERLERVAAELGVSGNVRFLGSRPNREMAGLLSSGDIAVFPSLMEATSVAALEALSCELPVAASRVGGLPEIIDEDVGTLFEPGDPEDLARRVNALLARDDLAGAGARGRARVVERWSNARLAERHLEIYRALLDRGAGKRSGKPEGKDGEGQNQP